jgi:lysophospholipase L1-like esterase
LKIILTIGDSHTAGFPEFDPIYGGNAKSSYQYWLKKSLVKSNIFKGLSIKNQGICGDTSKGVLYRLNKNLKRPLDIIYDLVILNGGANDFSYDISSIQSNLQTACENVRRNGIPVILCSIPPFGDEFIRNQLKKITEELESYVKGENDPKIIFHNWNKLLSSNSGLLKKVYSSKDGVHLSIEGYKVLGEDMSYYVQKLMS